MSSTNQADAHGAGETIADLTQQIKASREALPALWEEARRTNDKEATRRLHAQHYAIAAMDARLKAMKQGDSVAATMPPATAEQVALMVEGLRQARAELEAMRGKLAQSPGDEALTLAMNQAHYDIARLEAEYRVARGVGPNHQIHL